MSKTTAQMDQHQWARLGPAGRERWLEEHGVKPSPRQLAPYFRKRIEVVTSYDETRRFWVGVSSGWGPCYLELKRRDSRGGSAADSSGYKSIRIINHGN